LIYDDRRPRRDRRLLGSERQIPEFDGTISNYAEPRNVLKSNRVELQRQITEVHAETP